MRIHKFQTTEAFVAIDLVGADASSGPVRWAKKVLQGGAKDLARSQTYTYAALGMQRGGASAGISAGPEERSVAIDAFLAEVGPLVADRTYLPDAAKGVGAEELAPLTTDDPRDQARLGSFAERCDGLSAAVTAETLVGLEGRTVAIEGFGVNGSSIVAAVVERGATVTAVSTAAGTVSNPAGLDPAALASLGTDGLEALGEVTAPDAVFDVGADVVFAGSKTGIVDHTVAARIGAATALVSSGRLAMTARGLAVLRSAGVVAPADFVSLAGSTIAAWGEPSRTDDEILTAVAESTAALGAEHRGHADGAFLAACHMAEAFLSTWQDELPFGRPLAP